MPRKPFIVTAEASERKPDSLGHPESLCAEPIKNPVGAEILLSRLLTNGQRMETERLLEQENESPMCLSSASMQDDSTMLRLVLFREIACPGAD